MYVFDSPFRMSPTIRSGIRGTSSTNVVQRWAAAPCRLTNRPTLAFTFARSGREPRQVAARSNSASRRPASSRHPECVQSRHDAHVGRFEGRGSVSWRMARPEVVAALEARAFGERVEEVATVDEHQPTNRGRLRA